MNSLNSNLIWSSSIRYFSFQNLLSVCLAAACLDAPALASFRPHVDATPLVAVGWY